MDDVAPLQRGFDLPNTQLVKGDYPVVYSNGILNHHISFKIQGPGVVTGRSGTIGKVTFVENAFWPHNTSLWVKDFKNNDPRFVFYLYVFLSLEKFSTGSGVPTLNRNDVHDQLIKIPPTLAEQQAIAKVLSDTDELIQALERKIEKKNLVLDGTTEALLNPDKPNGIRLRGFEKFEWKKTTIGAVAEITTGNKNTQDRVSDGKYPFYVRSQKVERINTYSFDGEGILTAGDGVGTGKVFHYVNGKVDIHQRVYLIYDFKDDIDGYFLYLVFKRNFYNRMMMMTAKSSVDSVRREMIANMEVYVPNSIDEQKAISSSIKDLSNEIESLEKNLSKYKILKQALMQQLLTGKIRLV